MHAAYITVGFKLVHEAELSEYMWNITVHREMLAAFPL